MLIPTFVDFNSARKTGRGRKGDRSDGNDDQKLYLQSPLLELRIPETEIIFLTDLPEGMDSKEWIASHTIGFFEHINLLYGTISEFCTPSTCPEMNGPGPRQYIWFDDKGKKSRLSAPQYIDYIMTLAQKTINDECVFPTKHGMEFPTGFEQHVKKLHRLLFHVIAHVYHAHFKEIVLLQLHAHLNALFAHFIEFNLKFHTVEEKELEVLSDLIVALRLIPPPQSESNASVNHNSDAGTIETATTASLTEEVTSSSAQVEMENNSEENKENILQVNQVAGDDDDTDVIVSQPTVNSADIIMLSEGPGDQQEENCVEMT